MKTTLYIFFNFTRPLTSKGLQCTLGNRLRSVAATLHTLSPVISAILIVLGRSLSLSGLAELTKALASVALNMSASHHLVTIGASSTLPVPPWHPNGLVFKATNNQSVHTAFTVHSFRHQPCPDTFLPDSNVHQHAVEAYPSDANTCFLSSSS
ncbi:hypothetical protein BU16DRAFT_68815 [Lophium mytilinum]|uniref:Uncharacterized protein n=1 Tax=Lophium mytilinum TaxID=390894 RepID=A0A6A6QP18_9PEZI|nr:hypothetical protein BU16DRAFT_68815 [Lophium mytilinum]